MENILPSYEEAWLRGIECSADFIARLTDGKSLATQYKWIHLASIDDTEEGELLGKLWEEHNDGSRR